MIVSQRYKPENKKKKRQIKTNSVHTASGGDSIRPETELGALKKAGYGGEGARDTPKAAPHTHPVLGSTPRTARKKCRTGRNRTLDRSLHYWALTTYAYFPTAPAPSPKASLVPQFLYISLLSGVSVLGSRVITCVRGLMAKFDFLKMRPQAAQSRL